LLQRDVTVLAREGNFSAAGALVLLHAGDAMVAGVEYLGFSISLVHGLASRVGEKGVAGFILPAR